LGMTIEFIRIGAPTGYSVWGIDYRECAVVDVPGWDSCGKYVGDRALADLLSVMPHTVVAYDETGVGVRPESVPLLREQVVGIGVNQDRWELLCDALESDPSLYIEFRR
jgi:hypothetical protein